MIIPDLIDNKPLFTKKYELINSLRSKFHKSEYSFTNFLKVVYQDIPLEIISEEGSINLDLQKILPPSWLIKKEAVTKIYIISPLKFNFSGEQWGDEFSQDCDTFSNCTMAIQRDFAAVELTPNEIVVITEPKLSDGFYNFLRWFLPRKMLLLDQFVFHSSCVVFDDGCARMFLGVSGAGKSTIANMAGERLVLGDDMNVVSSMGGEFFARGGAIGGQFYPHVDYSKKYPIKGLYWIHQADHIKVTEVPKTEAVNKILASMANIFWQDLPTDLVNKNFEFAVKLAYKVPVYDLNFNKTPELFGHV